MKQLYRLDLYVCLSSKLLGFFEVSKSDEDPRAQKGTLEMHSKEYFKKHFKQYVKEPLKEHFKVHFKEHFEAHNEE